MERCKVKMIDMSVFNDKTFRFQAFVIVSILLIVILSGQLAVMRIAGDYKEAMISHDYAVAGYLSLNGAGNSQVVQAFTSEKADADRAAGFALLSYAGYEESVNNSLLPEVESFSQRNSLLMLAYTLAFSMILLAVAFSFVKRRDKKLKEACDVLRRFMEGDTDARLEDRGEGSLFRLFASVNNIATSLTAHIEKEKKSREFLKDTISDISHQLKTPLAALQMYSEIITEEKTGNDVVESFTSKSRRELMRMENLIQNLLKLAKLDAGTIELEKEGHQLSDFLEACIDGFTTRAALSGKDLILSCDRSLVMCFDEVWLKEAVGNIIKNALDHTGAGGRIEITCIETAVASEITVRDNGTGIHPEDIHHIFKRFYRSRFSKDRQGVGIGLALSKSIVEKHGGTITVQSELGKGAEFHLIFPKLTNM